MCQFQPQTKSYVAAITCVDAILLQCRPPVTGDTVRTVSVHFPKWQGDVFKPRVLSESETRRDDGKQDYAADYEWLAIVPDE